jgi:hypothetical protein
MATNVTHRLPTSQDQAVADLTGYEDTATLRWQQACVQAANTLTALPNDRYVNVRMERMRQGLELAQRGAVTLPEDGEDLSAVVRSGGIVKLLGMILSPDNSRHFPEAIATNPTLRQPAPYL